MKLHIEGMTCNHCVKSVTEALEATGATDIHVSLDKKSADFQPKEGTGLDLYIAAIEDIGFEARG